MADRTRPRAAQSMPAQEPSKAPVITLLVLIAVAALGAYGFRQLKQQQTATHSVIMDLKTETVKEIKAGSAKAVAEIKEAAAGAATGAPGAGAKVVAGIDELKSSLAAMQADQKALLNQIAALQAKTAAPAPAGPVARADDGIPDPQNASVYFPLAVAKGPKIDVQIKTLLPAVKDRAAKGDCRANVSGYSDTLGNDDANLRLSQKRADYVAEKLKAAGLAIGEVKAWGERRLEAFSVDGVQNEKNRRVVIEVHCGPMPEKAAPAMPAAPKAEEKQPEPSAAPAKPSS